MKTALELINVTQKYQNKILLHNINLKIKYHNFTVLFGESGSGKTTLIKTIMKETKLIKGKLKLYDFNEVELAYTRNNLYKKIQIVDQNFQQYFNPFFTVYDFLLESIQIEHNLHYSEDYLNINTLEKERIIKYSLSLFNLSESLLYSNIQTLSFGQQQRLMLCRMLILKPDIIILDEATSSWDVFNILFFLKQIQRFFKTLLVISHNIRIFAQFADHIIILKKGKIYENINNIKQHNILTLIEQNKYPFKNSYSRQLFKKAI